MAVPPVRRRSFLLGSCCVFGLAQLPCSGVAGARGAGRNHALLVAVTQYPHLDPEDWLSGPNNDVEMMHAYLRAEAPRRFAPADIRVLATDLDLASAAPTLDAIRHEMARLARTVQAGDFVFLHFAGHGSEQPARFPEQEVDGRDQVFMPVDVRRMTAQNRHWPNGYVDKDIKEDITSIRAKGAFVWAVFDCCHAGTITRALEAVPAGEVSRKIDLRRHDIPADMWAGPSDRMRGTGGLHPRTIFGPTGAVGLENDLAPLVAFFAAQATEETPELPLPAESAHARQMGLFSFTLLSKLRENPYMSFRQLGQGIHHAYLSSNRSHPSPLFEGALEARVFALEGDALPLRQWRISRDGAVRSIAAGELHLLAAGARLAVLADPTHDLDQALGMVEIESTDALRSRLGPTSDTDDLPALAVADIPDNAHARLIEGVVDMQMRVAVPDPAAHPDHAALVQRLLDAVAQDARMPARVRLVAPDAPADLRLSIRSEAGILAIMADQGATDTAALRATLDAPDIPRLWLMDASAALSLRAAQRPVSRPLHPDDDERMLDLWLRSTLTAAHRATNLARLAQFDDFAPGDVAVTVTRLPRLHSPLSSGQRLPAHRTGIVHPGNVAHIRVENAGSVPVVVNVLYIASTYSITSMLPHPVGLRAAEFGEENAAFDAQVLMFTDTSFGHERILVVVTEAASLSNPLDLSFLEQGGVRGALTSDGVAPTGFGAMIRAMADGVATRGDGLFGHRYAAQDTQRGAIHVFAVHNLPATS